MLSREGADQLINCCEDVINEYKKLQEETRKMAIDTIERNANELKELPLVRTCVAFDKFIEMIRNLERTEDESWLVFSGEELEAIREQINTVEKELDRAVEDLSEMRLAFNHLKTLFDDEHIVDLEE